MEIIDIFQQFSIDCQNNIIVSKYEADAKRTDLGARSTLRLNKRNSTKIEEARSGNEQGNR